MTCAAPAPAPTLDAVDVEVERLTASGWTFVRADIAPGRVRLTGWTPEGVPAGALVGAVGLVATALRSEGRVQAARERAVAALREGP